jgi:outer membrane protein OmpA-like peptidoglycan-associated protein
MKKILTVTLITLVVSGCASTPSGPSCQSGVHKAVVGAGVGAVGGAAAGAAIGAIAGDAGKGAWIGAAAGTVLGTGVGYYLQAQEDELRASLKGSGIDIERQGCDLAVIMPGNAAFASGSANLTPNFTPSLDSVAAVLKKSPELSMTVSGHTDSVGKSTTNEQLSKNRADSVARYLAKHGISGQRINTAGLADKAPIADNTSEQGRAKNRRVEITIHAPQQ